MKVLDLFSGIGGFSLGLERAGFTTVAFCEIEPYCQAVLRKHWPDVPIYDDIRKLTIGRLAADGIYPDAICGGFPCQDISFAGEGAGIEGERSGLWSEYSRLIGELRPRFAIVENVSALLNRGMGKVLGDLAALGFDAEWHSIPASAVGAPHIRDRVWIVAYPSEKRPGETRKDSQRSAKRLGRGIEILANATGSQARCAQPLDSNGQAQGGWQIIISSLGGCDSMVGASDWHTEPGICRVADGVSANVDRVGALGNAVIPQIPEIIGRAIMKVA